MSPPRALLACFACLLVGSSGNAQELATRLRRPVALVQSVDGRHLYVANRESGTVSVVDLEKRAVAIEHAVGKRLADLAAVPGTNRLLAVDEAAHELVALAADGEALRVVERLAVSPYPVSVAVSPDGSQATIASLWSRRLTFVRLASPSLQIASVLDLAIAPRSQLLLPAKNRLLVADSFGGRLAIVDPTAQKLIDVRDFPGHNVRGLAASADGQMLLVSHQMLNELAHSIRNDIHWGLLMSNDLRWLRIDAVLAGGKELYQGAHMHPLGEAGRGGGDPGAVDVAADGTVVVAISGVNEVAMGREDDFAMQRVSVPSRPTAVRVSADGKTAFVASTFDDSVSIIDLQARKVTATVALGPQPELSLAERGELLFYDARLSHDGWMSCHSCHTDGHANGQMNDNFSDRSFGAPKRVLSLLGLKGTLPLAWSGEVQTLERQIRNSVESTMQREETLPRQQAAAIAAYVETLEPPPSLAALRGASDAAAIARGQALFEQRDCGRCHAPPTYTTPKAYDVGLVDAHGASTFNPPSLRGLSQRGPFFHDGRAKTLADVFLEHGHPEGESAYSAAEIADLVAFLESL